MNTPYAREHANTKSEFIFKDNGKMEVKDAAIIWSNFEGRDGFNRSFKLVLSDAVAEKLKNEGWYVLDRENPDGDVTHMVEIAVGDRAEQYCPNIVRYSTFNGKRTSTQLGFEDMKILDSGAYEHVSVTINPREKNKPDKYGTIKGYLGTLRCIAVPTSSNTYDEEYDRWLEEGEE